MSTFHLQVVTPDGQAFDAQAEKVVCRTIYGDVCILADHADYCTALGMGEAHIVADGKTRRAACIGGMLSVMQNEVRLVATTWEWEEDIDFVRANLAKERAEKQLAAKEKLDKRDMALAEARLKRALVRSSLKGGSGML